MKYLTHLKISRLCLWLVLMSWSTTVSAQDTQHPKKQSDTLFQVLHIKLPSPIAAPSYVSSYGRENTVHQVRVVYTPHEIVGIFDYYVLDSYNKPLLEWTERRGKQDKMVSDSRPDEELEKAIAAIPALQNEMTFVRAWKEGKSHLFYNNYTPGKPLPAVGETLLAKMFRHSGADAATDVLLIEYLKEIEERVFLPHLQIDAPLDSAAFKYGAPQKMAAAEVSWMEHTWQSILSFFKSLLGMEINSELPVISKDPEFAKQNPVFRDLRSADIIHSVEKTVLEMAALPQAKNRALYYTAAAYLEIMKQDFKTAAQHLAKAKATDPNPGSKLFMQARYLEMLSAVMQAEKMNPGLEKLLLHTQMIYMPLWHQRLLWTEIARLYLKNGQIIDAVMAFSAAGADHTASGLMEICASSSEINELLRRMQKPKLPTSKQTLIAKTDTLVYDACITSFETLKREWFSFTQDEIRELAATKLLQQGKFEEGLIGLDSLDSRHWHINPSDFTGRFRGCIVMPPVFDVIYWHGIIPLAVESDELTPYVSPDDPRFHLGISAIHDEGIYGHIPLCLESDTATLQMVSKPVFVQKIVELEKKAATASGQQAAQYYFQIANALRHSKQRWMYNAGLWNTGFLAGDYAKTGLQGFLEGATPGVYPFNVKEFATEFYNRKTEFIRRYGSASLADQYEQKATALSTDNNQPALTKLFSN